MTKLRSECFCNSHESFFATELGVKKGVTFLEAYGLELNFLQQATFTMTTFD